MARHAPRSREAWPFGPNRIFRASQRWTPSSRGGRWGTTLSQHGRLTSQALAIAPRRFWALLITRYRRPPCRRLRARLGKITAYRTLVGVVQPAVLGTVSAVAVVLKLVVMPGHASLLDYGVLATVHLHTSLSHSIPFLPAPRQGHSPQSAGTSCSRQRELLRRATNQMVGKVACAVTVRLENAAAMQSPTS